MSVFNRKSIQRIVSTTAIILTTFFMVPASTAHAASSCVLNSDGYCEVVFSYTGSVDHWTVPTGVTEIKVTLAGGVGYDWGHGFNYQLQAEHSFTVSPGEQTTISIGSGAGAWPNNSVPGSNPLGMYLGGNGIHAGGAGSYFEIGEYSLVAAGSGGRYPNFGNSGAQNGISSTTQGNGSMMSGGGGGFHGGAGGFAGTCALNGVEKVDVCSSIGTNVAEVYYGTWLRSGFLKISYLSPDFAAGPHLNSVKTIPGGFSVNFSAPLYSGSSSIVAYEYSLDHGVGWHAFENTVLSGSYSVTGLVSGAKYSVAVRAVNASGGGQSSNEISDIVIPKIPEVINDLTISDLSATSVRLNWTKPNDGGLPISSYQVLLSTDGGVTWNSIPESNLLRSNDIATSVKVTGLIPSTNYSFNVVAQNDVGTAASSINSSIGGDGSGLKVDFFNSPTSPTMAEAGLSKCNSTVSTSLTFNWGSGKPVVNGSSGTCGSDNFLAHFSGFVQWPGSIDGSTTTVTFTTGSDDGSALFINDTSLASMWTDQGYTNKGGSITLASGVLYPFDFWYFENSGLAQVSLIASSSNLMFFQSRPLVAIKTLEATAPLAPTITSLSANRQQAIVNFSGPVDNSGAAITNYEYSTDNGSTWTGVSPAQVASPIIISGLNYGTSYSVKLRALNAVGSGAESNAVSVKPIAPASAPTISGVVASNGQATLSITAPSQINDSSLSGYDYSINNGSTWSRFPSATGPFTINGLTNATAYQVKVRAINSAGAGEASAAVTVNPTRLVPAKPVIASVVGGNASATVNITTPTDVTAQSITGYQYSIDKGATYQSAVVSNGSFTISGLTNGVTTSVQIRATNFNGTSLASVAKSVIPATTPSAPGITTITPSAGALSIAFTAPNTGGSAITNYQYSLDGGLTWVVPKTAVRSSPIRVTGLPNATTYQVSIRAVNAKGAGSASTAVSATTPVLVPSAPVVTSISKTRTTITIDFDSPVNNGGGTITNYAYSTDRGRTWAVVSPASAATRVVIAGLNPSTLYPVQIAAINSAGRGASSALTGVGTLH